MRWARLPMTLLSPAGAKARLSIFIFHRVLPEADPLFPGEIDAKRFDRVCGWVGSMFDVMPLDEAVRRLGAGTLPARAACITFDDGYADNHEQALPILQRHGLRAIFYIASGFLDGGRMWNDTVIEAVRRATGPTFDLRHLGVDELGRFALNDIAARRRAIDQILVAIKHRNPPERAALTEAIAQVAGASLPNDLMMRTEQVRDLRRSGMLIGAHTVSHPILATLDATSARLEIDQGRRALEAIIGEPVRHFAYPNGKPGQDYVEANVAMVRDMGFDSAVCTAWGAARSGTDPFQLPRFTPWDETPGRFAVRLMRNLARH